MHHHAKRRRAMLLALWRDTKGNPDAHTRISKLADQLGISAAEAIAAAKQMEKDGWIGHFQLQSDGDAILHLEMPGILEAERLDEHFIKRWATDPKVAVPLAITVVGNVIAIVIRLFCGL